jgi:hypothetical protein
MKACIFSFAPNWICASSLVAGGARVVGHFALGMAEEAYEHPGHTALQVGAGALAAGAAWPATVFTAAR